MVDEEKLSHSKKILSKNISVSKFNVDKNKDDLIKKGNKVLN